MKTLTLLSVLFVAMTSFSCKKCNDVNARVIKDCTGVYLRINTSDYRVCNKEKLNKYNNGDEVNATFKLSSGHCEADEDIVCEMLHEYKHNIVVTKID